MISRPQTWRASVALWCLAACWPTACVVNELGTAWQWNLAMGAAMSPAHEVAMGDTRVQVTLTRALVSIVALEAIPCGDVVTRQETGSLSLLPRAHAHGGMTPTRMATPHVIDLLAVDPEAWSVSLIHPPPGTYCWVRVTVGPADRDAVGMPADQALNESALLLHGRYALAGDSTQHEITVSSARVQSIDVPLTDEAGQETPLTISKTQRNVEVDVWLDDVRALDGVDISASAETLGGLHVIANVLASVQVRGCTLAPCAR